MSTVPFRSEEDVRASASRIREHLDGGGLLGYPTETVYGLGCRAVAEDVDALAELKGRPEGKPFLLLAASRAMVRALELDLSGFADRLGEAFWPGPITLVLRGGEATLPNALRGPEGGIAVRVTSQPAMAQLIDSLGYPITSTSANRPRKPPAAGAAGIEDAFPEAVSRGQLLILDGGVLGNRPPSTVVDCTGSLPAIIREGAIPRHEVMDAAEGRAP